MASTKAPKSAFTSHPIAKAPTGNEWSKVNSSGRQAQLDLMLETPSRNRESHPIAENQVFHYDYYKPNPRPAVGKSNTTGKTTSQKYTPPRPTRPSK